MIRAARAGKRVVRLKGGDPFVFGRGAEEALALATAGISFEVVPGVSSAIAAPELAGIPVTHRGTASGFLVLSGHAIDSLECGPSRRPAEFGAARRLDGVGSRAELAQRLIAHGLALGHARGHRLRASTPGRVDLDRDLCPTSGRLEVPLGIAGVVVIGDVVRNPRIACRIGRRRKR
jgi:uroporphyrin-III C-methyltransferase/precorrin-2 dehydrogenase/sirohydrochlorin ferrochelatase